MISLIDLRQNFGTPNNLCTLPTNCVHTTCSAQLQPFPWEAKKFFYLPLWISFMFFQIINLENIIVHFSDNNCIQYFKALQLINLSIIKFSHKKDFLILFQKILIVSGRSKRVRRGIRLYILVLLIFRQPNHATTCFVVHS